MVLSVLCIFVVGVTFEKSYTETFFLTAVTKNDILALRITNEADIGASVSEGWI